MASVIPFYLKLSGSDEAVQRFMCIAPVQQSFHPLASPVVENGLLSSTLGLPGQGDAGPRLKVILVRQVCVDAGKIVPNTCVLGANSSIHKNTTIGEGALLRTTQEAGSITWRGEIRLTASVRNGGFHTQNLVVRVRQHSVSRVSETDLQRAGCDSCVYKAGRGAGAAGLSPGRAHSTDDGCVRYACGDQGERPGVGRVVLRMYFYVTLSIAFPCEGANILLCISSYYRIAMAAYTWRGWCRAHGAVLPGAADPKERIGRRRTSACLLGRAKRAGPAAIADCPGGACAEREHELRAAGVPDWAEAA